MISEHPKLDSHKFKNLGIIIRMVGSTESFVKTEKSKRVIVVTFVSVQVKQGIRQTIYAEKELVIISSITIM